MTRTANDSYRSAVYTTIGERQIATCQQLITDLLEGFGITTTVTSVDESVPIILIIFIAARQDN